MLAQVDRLHVVLAGAVQPLGHEVDADHGLDAEVLGHPGAHVADRPEAEHGQRAAPGRVGVLHRLPGRGQHVGEEDEPVVRRPLRHLDRQRVAERHAQELGLTPRNLPVQLRVAEQRRAGAVLVDLGGLALAVQALAAHEARAARDVERHDDPVADRDLGDRRPDLGDDAHRLVAEDVALAEERAEQLVEVQVRAADPGRGDLDDHVRRILDRRVGHGVDADVALAVVGQCSHRVPLIPPSRAVQNRAGPCRGAGRP